MERKRRGVAPAQPSAKPLERGSGIVLVPPPAPMPHPSPFLEARGHQLEPAWGVTGLCAGYEGKVWRQKQLAAHVMKWLPEFALKHSEAEGLGHHNAVELLAKAARSIYETTKFQDRGEFGELLLHIALRQCFDTIPAVSKFFYKDARNDTVKGFDAVHIIAADKSLELWLGEVKFYSDIGQAIGKVCTEIEAHLERDYLRGEFVAITHKIDDSWQHAERLKKLLHPDTSLDKIFDCICVPVLLTYDSPTIKEFSEVSAEYVAKFEAEIGKHYETFRQRAGTKKLPAKIKVHLFLLPLLEKASFVAALDSALKAFQAIQL
jgi:hypothetical protein